jgi:hypothetical protein
LGISFQGGILVKVWWLDYHPVYNTISFVDSEERQKIREQLQRLAETSDSWESYSVKLEDKGKPSDFLGAFDGALVVSERAKDVLLSVPQMNASFLPLTSSDGAYYVLYVPTVLDCVNPSESKEKRIGSENILIDYEEFELRKEVIQDHHMFRIKLHEGNRVLPKVFVSDQLKELIEKRLEGFQLLDMWDSECSWKQKEQKYDFMCEEVDRSLKQRFSFEKAVQYVQKNKGDLAYSGKWALKVDEQGEVLLGTLMLDGSYSWINPYYYPPILLGLTWGVKERKSFFAWLK